MKQFLLFLVLFISVSKGYGQLVISPAGGNLTADSSAIVQINSTSQGFLPPRMTTIQQLAIVNPASGLMLFNTDSNQVMVFRNSNWVSIVGNGSEWRTNGSDISNANTGNVGIGTSSPQAKFQVQDSIVAPFYNGIYERNTQKISNFITFAPPSLAGTQSSTALNIEAKAANVLVPSNAELVGLKVFSDQDGIRVATTLGGTAFRASALFGKAIIVNEGNSGFGIENPMQKLELSGALKLADTSSSVTASNGVVRYNPTEGFQGKHNNEWLSILSPWLKNGSDISNSNAGNVGIGITNPTNKFSVKDNNTAVKIHKTSTSNGNIFTGDSYSPGMEIFVDSNTINNSSIIQTGTALNIDNVRGSALQATSRYGISSYATDGRAGLFSNNGVSPVLITLGGNVGFGIPNPFQKLELNGAIKLADTSSDFSANNGVIRYNTTEGFQGKHNNVWKSLSSSWQTVNNDIINSNSGNVGIGVSNPIHKLSASDNNTVMKIHKKSTTTGINYLDDSYKAGMEIFIDSNTINNTSIIQTGSALTINNVRGSAFQAISKYGISSFAADGTAGIFSNNSSSPVLLALGGNVGFGVTNPLQKLEIDGALKIGDQHATAALEDGVIKYTPSNGFQFRHNNVWQNIMSYTAGTGISIVGNTISATSAGNGWTETGGNIYQNNPFTNSTVTVGTDVAPTDARMKILGNSNLPIGLRLSSGLANPANGIALSTVGRINANASTAREDIETGGAIIVGGAAVSPSPVEGTIQYAGTDLQGYVGGQWKSLTATGSGGSSPWTVNGNDINNSNSGKILVGSATGSSNAKMEVVDNTSFAKVMSISNNGSNYMTVLDVKETSTSGGPLGCDVCSGTAAIKSIASKGDALYASSESRGMYVKGGNAFYPAVVIENNSTAPVSLDIAKQIQIRGGSPGAGKVLTSDATGLATWQTPSGGGGSGSGWNTTGNSGLSNTNFIGNTDAVDLNFKTNNNNGLTLTSGGALLATGSTSTGTTPATGAGSRMMWIPAKGAFRAGTVTGTHWNDIQLASYSTAFGYNTIAGGNYSFAAGNAASATGFTSFAIGDNVSASASRSIAMGANVNAGYQGAFCFGDMDFSNTLSASTINQMNMRFSGGYRLFTNSSSSIGVQLTSGGNSWATISDRRKKENLQFVDGESFLKKIACMPLSSWNYIGQDKKKFRHYGPMAQDFFEAFGQDGIGVVGNDTTIAGADFDGVNLIAIQALEARTTKLQQENDRLHKLNNELQAAMEAMRKDLNLVLQSIQKTPLNDTRSTEDSLTAQHQIR